MALLRCAAARHSLLALVASSGCLPGTFDALTDAAPVRTVSLGFPDLPDAELRVALTVAPASAGGRGRVLLSDAQAGLAWLRLESGGEVELRYASAGELGELAGYEGPSLTGLAVHPDASTGEAFARLGASADGRDRVVRFELADFARRGALADDARVYEWVDASPRLGGALAVVALDEGLPEILSSGEDGLFIWAELGMEASAYAQIHAADPEAFADDPSQGWGLTWCPDLHPSAVVGGRFGPAQAAVALAVEDDELRMIGVGEPPQQATIGAPIYACDLAQLQLPGAARSLAVVDLDSDEDDDLLVGAPALGQVWIYENLGDGLPDAPTRVLTPDVDAVEFGASIAHVELGGEAPAVIVVGDPGVAVGGEGEVGRVFVFDASSGELLRTIEDLEPRAGSRHGLALHGLGLDGREELVVSGGRELRIHWRIHPDDEGPSR